MIIQPSKEAILKAAAAINSTKDVRGRMLSQDAIKTILEAAYAVDGENNLSTAAIKESVFKPSAEGIRAATKILGDYGWHSPSYNAMDEALTKAYETDLAEPIRFTTDGGTYYFVTVDQFKRRLSLFESDIASLIRRQLAITAERDAARSTITDLENKLSRMPTYRSNSLYEADCKIVELDNQIALLKSDAAITQTSLKYANNKMLHMAETVGSDNHLLASFRHQLDTSHRIIGELRVRITGITIDRDGARALVARLNRDIDSLKKQVADLTATAYKGVNHTICAAEVSGTKNGHSWFVRDSVTRLERARWYVDKHTKSVIDFINGNYYCEWTVSSYAREPIVVVGPSDEYCLQKLCDYLILKGY